MCNFKAPRGSYKLLWRAAETLSALCSWEAAQLHHLSISLAFSFSVSRQHASAPLPRVSHLGVASGLPSQRCQVCLQTELPLTCCAPTSLIHVFWLPILSASIKFPHNLATTVQCLQNDARKRCSQLSHSASYLFFCFLHNIFFGADCCTRVVCVCAFNYLLLPYFQTLKFISVNLPFL